MPVWQCGAMPNIASVSRLVSGARSWEFPDLEDASPPVPVAANPNDVGRRWKTSAAAVVGLLSLAVVVASVGVVWRASQAPAAQLLGPPEEQQWVQGSTDSSTLTPLPPAPSTVVVHVSGAVASPGLVELPEGSRVHDAISSAGGPVADADTGSINLARVLVDGEHVVVPLWGEQIATDSKVAASGPISLSSADQGALDGLPGIGPSLAKRIIDWRETHGPFAAVEDVLAVPGIGESTLEHFRELVVP